MSMYLWKCYFFGMCLLSSCWAWSCWWVISKEFIVKWIEPFGSFYRGSDLVFYPVHLFVYIFYLEELLLLTFHRQHSPSLLKKATLTKIHPWACSSYRLRQNPNITFSRCSQTSPAHPFFILEPCGSGPERGILHLGAWQWQIRHQCSHRSRKKECYDLHSKVAQRYERVAVNFEHNCSLFQQWWRCLQSSAVSPPGAVRQTLGRWHF